MKYSNSRNKGHVILFLVEGDSEINALSASISQLYEDADPNAEVFFALLTKPERDTGSDFFTEEDLRCIKKQKVRPGGDITSETFVDPDNIEKKINKFFIKPFLQKNKIRPEDITEVIQIVDMDGAYVSDDCIVTADPSDNRKLPYYDDENLTIISKDRESIIERNARKRANINKLVSSIDIKIAGGNLVKYSTYFFSCNLDHYLYGEANLPSNEKVNRARQFSNEVYNDLDRFIDEICNRRSDMRATNYKKSWDFIKKNDNSIKAYTNLDVLVRRLLSE